MEILLSLFVVFIAAQVGAKIAQRLKLPSVVGEIAARCSVGPSVFSWAHINEPLAILAEISAVLLLFAVSLETRVDDLKKVGRVAMAVSVSCVVLPFLLGAIWAKMNSFCKFLEHGTLVLSE